MINTLEELYSALDSLYSNIINICTYCPDHDCEGYVWLLDQESNSLYNSGISVVEVNENIHFIHSFPEEEGMVRVDVLRPPCRLRSDNGQCSIYNSRPLVCRMYPVNILTHENKVCLVLMHDCQYSRQLEGTEKSRFVDRILTIFRNTSAAILLDILQTYRRVDNISAFPDGPNIYEIISPLEDFIQARKEQADVEV